MPVQFHSVVTTPDTTGARQIADIPGIGPAPTRGNEPGEEGAFAQLLAGLGNQSAVADGAMEDLAVAGEQDLHDVVLAVELESMAFELAVEIRNRLVDAYNEIFRMSV